MKKNIFAAYDFIRQNKFVTPDKIKIVESMLESERVVINWWCRQSGKTLTGVKIARDYAVNNSGYSVLVICPRSAISRNFIYVTGRSIDDKLIDSISTFFIKLKNGSIIQACVYNENVSFDDKDLVVIDEFDFIETPNFYSIVNKIKREIYPTFLQHIYDVCLTNKNTRMKFLLSSSKFNGLNLDLIKTLHKYSITYLNWEKLSLENDKIERMKKMLGDTAFKNEYDSYRADDK